MSSSTEIEDDKSREGSLTDESSFYGQNELDYVRTIELCG